MCLVVSCLNESTVKLGRLKLPDFEYPDNISFGGAYKVNDLFFEVILGTGSSGLFNFIEGETDTWQRQIDGLTATDVTTMFINPDNFNLFAGTSNGEIHESPDEGITWEIKGKLPGNLWAWSELNREH